MNQKKLLNPKIQKFRNRFNSLNIYTKFTIIFFIIMFIGFLPIEIKNGSFLFSGLFADRNLGIDGLKQHIVFMHDYISHIKDGIFDLYRFDIGLGSDFINHYTYYSLFDPIMIIAYIIPLKHIEISFYLIIIVRLYLNGLAIIMLAKKVGITKVKSLLAVSIFYSFNVAILFSALRHPMFLNGPMYFALIILGYEKVKRGESPVLLILSVFLGLISQFYIFIYSTFGFILYVIIDSLKDFKNKKFKLFFRVNIYYLLGTLLGGFVLVTQLMATMAGARVGSKGFEFYQAIDYASLIFSNFIPVVGNHYTAGLGNFVVFIICLYFIINEKKKSTFSIFFIIILLLSFIATFSYIINMGSYVVNRWLFLITLPASIIIGKKLENKEHIDESSVNRVTKLFIVFVSIGIIFLLIFGVNLLNLPNLVKYIISTILVIATLYFNLRVYKSNINGRVFRKILQSSNLYRYVIYNSLFCLLIISAGYCFVLTPNNSLKTYYGNSDSYKLELDGDEFYRVEQKSYVAGVNDFSNDGIYYGYASTSSYNTMTNGNIIELINEYNINNSNNSVGYNGFNNRSRFMAINHVKYVIIRESDRVTPPFGFSLYRTILVDKYDESLKVYHKGGNILKDDSGNTVYEKAYIYINNYYMNFGVIFDTYMTKDDTLNLNSVEKELLLTKTIILDKNSDGVVKYAHSSNLDKVSVENYEYNNIEIIDNKIIAAKDNSLSFIIPLVTNSEVYVELSDFSNANYKLSFSTTYSTTIYEETVRNYGYGTNMHIEDKNHLVNLGYYENEENLKVTINFTEGNYSFSDIGYYLVDASNLGNEINLLNKNSLTNVVFTNSSFTGRINTSKPGYMYISIPYSDGFSAYIDGVETEVLRANTGYMAVFVEEGSKVLEIKYFTPGLEIGLYISVISLIIFILVVRFSLLHKTRINYQTNINEDENEKISRFF